MPRRRPQLTRTRESKQNAKGGGGTGAGTQGQPLIALLRLQTTLSLCEPPVGSQSWEDSPCITGPSQDLRSLTSTWDQLLFLSPQQPPLQGITLRLRSWAPRRVRPSVTSEPLFGGSCSQYLLLLLHAVFLSLFLCALSPPFLPCHWMIQGDI